jgi:hypothetical protein
MRLVAIVYKYYGQSRKKEENGQELNLTTGHTSMHFPQQVQPSAITALPLMIRILPLGHLPTQTPQPLHCSARRTDSSTLRINERAFLSVSLRAVTVPEANT